MSEPGDLSDVEARLLYKFSRLDPDEVRRCLSDSMAEFESARIRNFLVVLIERATTDRLRVLELEMGEFDASRGAGSQQATERPPPREMSGGRVNGRAVRTRRRVVPAIGG
jgi:hypothetical protein